MLTEDDLAPARAKCKSHIRNQFLEMLISKAGFSRAAFDDWYRANTGGKSPNVGTMRSLRAAYLTLRGMGYWINPPLQLDLERYPFEVFSGRVYKIMEYQPKLAPIIAACHDRQIDADTVWDLFRDEASEVCQVIAGLFPTWSCNDVPIDVVIKTALPLRKWLQSFREIHSEVCEAIPGLVPTWSWKDVGIDDIIKTARELAGC
jgi:hypothetical protein